MTCGKVVVQMSVEMRTMRDDSEFWVQPNCHQMCVIRMSDRCNQRSSVQKR